MYGRGYQGGGLGIGPPVTPPIIKNLLILNIAIFVAQILMSAGRAFGPLEEFGSVRPYLVWQQGWIWQPFTYMFLHGGLGHILMNMFALWMFGSPLAMVWGARRFLRFYLICGLGAGILISIYPYLLVALGWPSDRLLLPTLGASGAIYGVLLAYSLTWPDRTIMLIFPPVAFRAIWLIPILFFMTVAFGGGNVSHEGHLGGVLVGWVLLRRSGAGRLLPSVAQIKYRWNRWKMRRRLKAVRREDQAWQRRSHDDHTLH